MGTVIIFDIVIVSTPFRSTSCLRASDSSGVLETQTRTSSSSSSSTTSSSLSARCSGCRTAPACWKHRQGYHHHHHHHHHHQGHCHHHRHRHRQHSVQVHLPPEGVGQLRRAGNTDKDIIIITTIIDIVITVSTLFRSTSCMRASHCSGVITTQTRTSSSSQSSSSLSSLSSACYTGPPPVTDGGEFWRAHNTDKMMTLSLLSWHVSMPNAWLRIQRNYLVCTQRKWKYHRRRHVSTQFCATG